MTILVDTSALFAVLDRDDARHNEAAVIWRGLAGEDLVTHAYVVVETLALVRNRLGAAVLRDLIDDFLPALRVELVDRALHDEAIAAVRAEAGATSVVDRVTIAFARRNGIGSVFAFERDLVAAGLRPLAPYDDPADLSADPRG